LKNIRQNGSTLLSRKCIEEEEPVGAVLWLHHHSESHFELHQWFLVWSSSKTTPTGKALAGVSFGAVFILSKGLYNLLYTFAFAIVHKASQHTS
jgi:hypothetical protein